ncbi:hypothetical protein Z951_00700 [Streptomyces sp. PRh5]|nr:hypothetical protein Z951_00700 [Streptomyces sp. PRh5]
MRTSISGRAGCVISRACWAGGSRSPRRSRVRPAVRTRRVTLASFGPSVAVGAGDRAGQRTCQASGPKRRRSPGCAGMTGICADRAVRRTDSAWPGGSSRAVVSIAPTARPRNAPVSPATWSAWKWVRIRSGIRTMPRERRQRSTARGSGPVSTTTAVPGPAARTRASPWPTSQATIRQPGGGQPVMTRTRGAGRTTASSTSSAHTAHSRRWRSSRRPARTTARETAASRSAPVQPSGQSASAPGSAAPVRATWAIHSAGQPADQAIQWASGGATAAAASAAKPRVVAEATATSAMRLQGIATRLTRAAITTTTGAQTAWAAAAAASASATRGGTPRRWRAVLHPGAMVSRAPVASTESRNP